VRPPLHRMRRCWRSLYLSQVSVVYSGYLSNVPGNRDGIPSRFGHNAAISGIAPPVNTGALLEGF
jgi:hypothetical protein